MTVLGWIGAIIVVGILLYLNTKARLKSFMIWDSFFSRSGPRDELLDKMISDDSEKKEIDKNRK